MLISLSLFKSVAEFQTYIDAGFSNDAIRATVDLICKTSFGKEAALRHFWGEQGLLQQKRRLLPASFCKPSYSIIPEIGVDLR